MTPTPQPRTCSRCLPETGFWCAQHAPEVQTHVCECCRSVFTISDAACLRCGLPYRVERVPGWWLMVNALDDRRVYEVTWNGTIVHYVAFRRKDATRHAMRSARAAGTWRPGGSLGGLRARWLRVQDVPPDVDFRVLVADVDFRVLVAELVANKEGAA